LTSSRLTCYFRNALPEHLPGSIAPLAGACKVLFSLILNHLLLPGQDLKRSDIAQGTVRVVIINIREATQPLHDIINLRERWWDFPMVFECLDERFNPCLVIRCVGAPEMNGRAQKVFDSLFCVRSLHGRAPVGMGQDIWGKLFRDKGMGLLYRSD